LIEPFYTKDRLIENIYAPYPMGRRTPLSVSHPELALEWLYSKNCGYGPEDFSYGSSVKVWWRCRENRKHTWQAAISNRTPKVPSGCPQCYDATWGIDLRDYPTALPFFDKAKNAGIDPFKLPLRDDIKWRCPVSRDHVWTGKFNPKVAPYFCPFCRGRRPSKTHNLSQYPEIANQWHPTKNGKLTPRDIAPGSKKRYWFKCNEASDHVFQQTPYARTRDGYGCPFCSHRSFAKSHSLKITHPKIARQWHPTKNGQLTPEEITAAYKEKVWWMCRKGTDHEWLTTPYNRTRDDSSCPFCVNRRLSKTNSLATMYPELSKEFDKKKNAPLTAKQVIATSATVIWWKCLEGHSWQREVFLRTKRDSACPICRPRRKPFKASLRKAFPKIAAQWHPTLNGNLTPDMVPPSYKKNSIWWICDKGPDHVFKNFVFARTTKGHGCPFCSNQRVSRTNSLAVLHPELCQEWHKTKNKSLTPKDVVPGSAKKVWWRCKNCKHEWQSVIYSRAGRKTGCPVCWSYPGE